MLIVEQDTSQTIFAAVPSSRGYNPHRLLIYPLINETEPRAKDLPLPCVAYRQLNDYVDNSLLAGWLETCDIVHNHIVTPTPEPRPSLPGLRLIDVQNRCIVSGDPRLRYAALSYTWGLHEQYCLVQDNVAVLSEAGSLTKFAESLGQVVHDAITVCTNLKIPFLWIDSLCIVQDDANDKSTQIQHMDEVYASSYVTLVVAGQNRFTSSTLNSGDAAASIPRVSKPATCAPPRFTLDGVTYAVRRGDPDTLQELGLEGSPWSSRGWTFQEFVLSHRVLVFADEEAFFYCNNGLLAESVYLAEEPRKSIQWRHMPFLSLCGSLHKSNQQSTLEALTIERRILQYVGSYLELVKFYMRRVLKFDHDVLNAFSGIIASSTNSLGRFHWGLPTALFARSLLLRVYRVPSWPVPSPRQEFPSWSWLGWKHKSPHAVQDIPHIPAHDSSNTFRPLIHIYACDESGSTALLFGPYDDQEGIEGYCSESIEKYNRHLALDPLPSQPSVMATLPFPTRNIFMSHLLIFWTHTAQIYLNYPDNGENMQYKLKWGAEQRELLDCVLIAVSWQSVNPPNNSGKEPDASYHVMFIERHDGIVRRIGVPIYPLATRQWLAGNPKKELVFLI